MLDTFPAVAESAVTPSPLPSFDIHDAIPPHAPVLKEDKTEPVRGFKLIMVKTMTASGQVSVIWEKKVVEMVDQTDCFFTGHQIVVVIGKSVFPYKNVFSLIREIMLISCE